MPLRDEIARERHDDFAWQRNARALDSHQQRDAGVTHGDDHGGRKSGQPADDVFDKRAQDGPLSWSSLRLEEATALDKVGLSGRGVNPLADDGDGQSTAVIERPGL